MAGNRLILFFLSFLLAFDTLAGIARFRRPTLQDGIVTYWPGNEASGNASDLGPNALTLTDVNSVSSTTGRVYPLTRDYEASSSQYLTRADTSTLSFPTGFTIATWCRIEAKPGASAMVMAAKWDNSAAPNTEYINFWKLSTDRFAIQIQGSGLASVDANTLGSPALETWYLVTSWWDGATLGIQVNNGTADTTAYTGTINNSTTAFALGCQFSSGSPTGFWDGEQGPTAIWNRRLRQEEIIRLYNGSNGFKYNHW